MRPTAYCQVYECVYVYLSAQADQSVTVILDIIISYCVCISNCHAVYISQVAGFIFRLYYQCLQSVLQIIRNILKVTEHQYSILDYRQGGYSYLIGSISHRYLVC